VTLAIVVLRERCRDMDNPLASTSYKVSRLYSGFVRLVDRVSLLLLASNETAMMIHAIHTYNGCPRPGLRVFRCTASHFAYISMRPRRTHCHQFQAAPLAWLPRANQRGRIHSPFLRVYPQQKPILLTLAGPGSTSRRHLVHLHPRLFEELIHSTVRSKNSWS